MKAQSATDILALDILLLEGNRDRDFDALKEQALETYESLRPINLIKDTFKDLTHSPDIKGGIGKAVIGLTTGYLLKKLMFGSSHNPLKNLAGAAFQAVATNIAAKNSDKIKEGSIDLFEIVKSFIMPKKKSADETHVS